MRRMAIAICIPNISRKQKSGKMRFGVERCISARPRRRGPLLPPPPPKTAWGRGRPHREERLPANKESSCPPGCPPPPAPPPAPRGRGELTAGRAFAARRDAGSGLASHTARRVRRRPSAAIEVTPSRYRPRYREEVRGPSRGGRAPAGTAAKRAPRDQEEAPGAHPREGCAPGGPGRRRARADVEESPRGRARRRPGAVGNSRIVAYRARSPFGRPSAQHAPNPQFAAGWRGGKKVYP